MISHKIKLVYEHVGNMTNQLDKVSYMVVIYGNIFVLQISHD